MSLGYNGVSEIAKQWSAFVFFLKKCSNILSTDR
jgi:hypothetical protein